MRLLSLFEYVSMFHHISFAFKGVFSEIFSYMIWSKFYMFSKYLNRKRRNISFIVQNIAKFTI